MSDVYVLQGGSPAQMAYDAISQVFHEDPAELSILLKVNTGFRGPAASGLCTHPEVVRGLIRYFKERNTKQLYVGDSSIVGRGQRGGSEIRRYLGCLPGGRRPVPESG